MIITKDCLSTGQEQACIRITQLFVCLFVRHHAKKMAKYTEKMAADCALKIKFNLDGPRSVFKHR